MQVNNQAGADTQDLLRHIHTRPFCEATSFLILLNECIVRMKTESPEMCPLDVSTENARIYREAFHLRRMLTSLQLVMLGNKV